MLTSIMEGELIVPRLFTELIQQAESEPVLPKPLAEFSDRSAIVVLGDPGAGKTTSFRHAASIEPNGLFVSLRQFRRATNLAQFHNKILFIDALDEVRAATESGSQVLDELIERLVSLGKPKFRLSCRASDWYGGLDDINLREASPDGQITVIRLEPLDEGGISAIVKHNGHDPHGFIARAEQYGVYELLTNPQSLKLMLKAVGSENQWPRTRTQLFELSSSKLAQEQNPEHGRLPKARVSSESILEASGYISALILCSDINAIALAPAASDQANINIHDINFDNVELLAAARTKLFHSEEPERIRPMHRTMAEYLAGRYLVNRIRAGLSLRRVLALMTGYDGGTLADLRGLYAWVACLLTEHAEILIGRDPLGVVLYGDVAPLPSTVKRTVIHELAQLEERDPWFRSENWAGQPFGYLSSPDLETEFRNILSNPERNPHLVSCVLDTLEHGDPLPNLRNTLRDFIYADTTQRFGLDPLRAFIHTCSECTSDLLRLLNDVHEGRLPDKDRRLRGLLLRTLYPAVIGAPEIIQYLVEDSQTLIGEYTMFLGYELVDATRSEDIPVLLDAIAEVKLPALKQRVLERRHVYARLMGKLIVRALSIYGHDVSPERLYRWLSVQSGEYERVLVEQEEAAQIKAYFETNTRVLCSLFKYWLSKTEGENPSLEMHKFWQLLQNPQPPRHFAFWLLAVARREPRDAIAHEICRYAIRLRTVKNRQDSPSIDQMFDFVRRYPRFEKCLLSDANTNAELYYLVPDWQWKDIRRNAAEKKRELVQREENSSKWRQHIEPIRNGDHAGLLGLFGKIYFAVFSDVNRAAKPQARLREHMSDDLVAAAMEGFVAVLRSPDLPSPFDIGSAAATNKHYPVGYAVLAGMDILSVQSMYSIEALPSRTLQAALCFHYANGNQEDRPWVKFVITRYTDLAADAFKNFWMAQLKAGPAHEHVPGIYQMRHDALMEGIAQRVAVTVLVGYPNCHEHVLESVLQAAIKHGNKDELLGHARKVLKKRKGLGAEQRTLWCAAAFLLAPYEFEKIVESYIGKEKDKALRLLAFIAPLFLEDKSNYRQRADVLGMVIRVIGHVVSPEKDERGFSTERTRTLISIIEHLGNIPTAEATNILSFLQRDQGLREYSNILAHVAVAQIKKRREAEFAPLSAKEVLEVLRGGRPVAPADLYAFVCDLVDIAAKAIRNRPTNTYRAFWNEEKGKLTRPKPENEGRNRLIEQLEPTLRVIGASAEPEGSYVEENRADIKILSGAHNLPIEVKRHYHKDVWVALRNQLIDKYMRDPATGGFGIYVVFWFGEAVGRRLPAPPHGIQRPSTAAEMEAAIRSLIPAGYENKVFVICIDCMPPPDELEGHRGRKAKVGTKKTKQTTKNVQKRSSRKTQ